MIKLKVDRDELRKEVEELSKYKDKRDNDYDNAFERKKYYKGLFEDMKKKVDEVVELRKEEKRRMDEKLSHRINDI